MTLKTIRVTLAALLLAVGWAAPAAAVLPGGGLLGGGVPTGPVSPGSLPWLACGDSTGALHTLTPQASAPGAVLDYTFYPCSPHTTSTVYAVAVYYQSDVAPFWVLATGQAFRTLPSGALSAVVQVEAGARAVCLVSSPAHRVACAEVEWGPDGSPALGAPLAPDAPAVSVAVGTVWPPADPVVVPVCPVCT